MRKKITDIELELPHSREKTAGYVYGARFSQDKDSSCFFICGAGKNDCRVYDNDTDGSGKFRQIGNFGSSNEPYMSMDTAPNGKLVAVGTSSGGVFISNYELTGTEDDQSRN